MNFRCLLFLAMIGLTLTLSSADVICEKIGVCWETKCCQMNLETNIESNDVSVSWPRDDTIELIWLTGNRKIEYLPVEVYRNFPKLGFYWAGHCAIKEISKKNFEQLKSLKWVALQDNQIEKISSNTFEGLDELRQVFLGFNRIKFMNGKLFEGFRHLEWVNLESNECINQRFNTTEEFKRLSQTVTEKCGFEESKYVINLNCGQVLHTLNTTNRIIGGTDADRGEFPFLVALLLESSQQFFCGGNLITSKHVLTAAHCMQEKGAATKIDPREILVFLGRHNLTLVGERGSEMRSIRTVIVHPDWKFNEQKYDADLALLVMERSIDFTDLIQPVCLSKTPQLTAQVDGTVVGWGKSEGPRRFENTPRKTKIKAVSAEECFEKDPGIGAIYSRRSFCAGGEGAGPCSGDSGSGFFVKIRELWTLRGLVSSSALKSDLQCDVNRYSIYTKLTLFVDWIEDTVGANS